MYKKTRGITLRKARKLTILSVVLCFVMSGCKVQATSSEKTEGAVLTAMQTTYKKHLVPLIEKNKQAKAEEEKKQQDEEAKKKAEEDAKREAEAQAYLAQQSAAAQKRYEIEKEREKAAEEAERDGLYNGNYNGMPRNLHYYTQRDPSWAGHAFGPAWNMANSGCVPTSVAMALTGVGISASPVSVADYLYNSTGEFNKRYPGGSGLAVKLATEAYGGESIRIGSQQALADALSQGLPVVALLGPGNWAPVGGSHAVVLHGYNNGYTYLYDVYTDTKSGAFSLGTIWSQRSLLGYDINDGGVSFHAIKKPKAKTEDTIWQDETGTVLRNKETGTKPDNDGISDIEGYTVISHNTSTDADGNKHTVNIYHKIVYTTFWQDEAGVSIKPQQSGALPDTDGNDVEGYTFIKTEEQPQANGDIYIINIYRKTE